MDIEKQQVTSEQISSATLPTLGSPGNDTKTKRSYPAIIHAAAVSAFVLPVAILPYLVARRQIVALRQRVVQLEKDTRILRSELQTTMTHQASELERLKTAALESSKEWQDLRRHYDRQEADRRASEEAMRGGLRKIQDETNHYSRNQAIAFRALGTSLGGVAAFMEEVELDLGLANGKQRDRRGVERLRTVALQMQTHSGPVEKNKDTSRELEESTK